MPLGMSTGTGGPPTGALPSSLRPVPLNARNLGSSAGSSGCAEDEGPAHQHVRSVSVQHEGVNR